MCAATLSVFARPSPFSSLQRSVHGPHRPLSGSAFAAGHQFHSGSWHCLFSFGTLRRRWSDDSDRLSALSSQSSALCGPASDRVQVSCEDSLSSSVVRALISSCDSATSTRLFPLFI